MSDNTLKRQERALFRDNFRKFLAKEVTLYSQHWEKDAIFASEFWHSAVGR